MGPGLARNSGPADRLGAVENNQNNQPYEPYKAVLGVPVGISGKIYAKYHLTIRGNGAVRPSSRRELNYNERKSSRVFSYPILLIILVNSLFKSPLFCNMKKVFSSSFTHLKFSNLLSVLIPFI